MKPEDSWKLDYCRPANWTVDLTPPQGEWDYEVEPGSYEERLLDQAYMAAQWSGFSTVIGSFFQQVGREASYAFDSVINAFRPVGEHITERISEMVSAVEEFDAANKALEEERLKENGIHTIRSIKPGINLPVRTFNSGPQQKKTGRRQSP